MVAESAEKARKIGGGKLRSRCEWSSGKSGTGGLCPAFRLQPPPDQILFPLVRVREVTEAPWERSTSTAVQDRRRQLRNDAAAPQAIYQVVQSRLRMKRQIGCGLDALDHRRLGITNELSGLVNAHRFNSAAPFEPTRSSNDESRMTNGGSGGRFTIRPAFPGRWLGRGVRWLVGSRRIRLRRGWGRRWRFGRTGCAGRGCGRCGGPSR
jgi:hypothetical protein